MTRWGDLFRLSNHSATGVQNDNLVWRFYPLKTCDATKKVALSICCAVMELAAPADVAKLSFFATAQYFIREPQPSPWCAR
jgi:hypothetical protein